MTADEMERIKKLADAMALKQVQWGEDWPIGYEHPADIERMRFARHFLACLDAIGIKPESKP